VLGETPHSAGGKRKGLSNRGLISVRVVAAAAVASGTAAAQAARPAPATSTQAAQRTQIEALIQRIETQQDLRFIRNGRSYSAAQAAEFLRHKWPARCAAVQTVDQFIDQCASQSSTTGKPYEIRQGNQTRPAAAVLREWAGLPPS
jgi:membrane-bound lytic murein transglycosylase